MASDTVQSEKLLLFWKSWLSQWSIVDFSVDGITYNCCEQYMMAEKARVFGDEESLQKVLETASPYKQKALGRGVRGFDEKVWNGVCRGVVYSGNLARFEQNAEQGERLVATGELILVEASPVDRIWGIGLAPDNPLAQDPAQWRGRNWLGIALMQVRNELSTRGGTAPIEDDELARQLERRRARPVGSAK